MQLSFLTGNVQDLEKAARLGFDGIELQAGAFVQATEGQINHEAIAQAKRLREKHRANINSLAFYEIAFKQQVYSSPEIVLKAYEQVLNAAEAIGVTVIASMAGFDAKRDWHANIQLFADRFGPVADLAEKRGIKLAFENWMAIQGKLPFRPVNIGGSPDTWDAMFTAVPSKALGLEFDPSHLYWQGIDHIRALHEFKDRIYHVHAKDTEMLPERRYRGGVNGDYFRFRIPGYGEINWTQFITALDEIGYSGDVAIEHEDPVYWDDRFDEGLDRGWQVLNPLIHPQERI
ncbi:MAG TPA: sugar phosphate isomerase/epimerase family protein [Ktedonobacteraceae bacterium]|jgi:sugar phosphate isomerase/epimerase|nr:sugar phosphate isomerase/epimerase family protein [Ktedonobacteraceae bacterium]